MIWMNHTDMEQNVEPLHQNHYGLNALSSMRAHLPTQGRSMIDLDVEAPFKFYIPKNFQGHVLPRIYTFFDILKLRPGPLCICLATPLAVPTHHRTSGLYSKRK